MAKGIVHNSRFACLATNAASGAAGSNLILNEVDTGVADHGTLVLCVNAAAGSDIMTDMEIWTSRASNFATSGTGLSAVTSDSTRLVVLTSDEGSLYAQKVLGGTVSDMVLTDSGGLSDINEDCMVIARLTNLSRYVNLQYDSAGTGGVISAVFIGHDLPEAPWKGARTAYS